MGVRILTGDCREALKTLPDQSVHCCVTSPPYFGLRDYGVDGQIGLERTPDEYVAEMVAVFREVRRVLRDDGTLWLNLGDSFSDGKVTNLADFIHRQLEGGVLFFGRTDPRRRSTQRIHVLIQDKAAPDDVLQPLFTAERIRIEDGQDDLCEIGGGLDAPVVCWASRSLRWTDPNITDAERVMDVPDNVRIILTTSYLEPDAPFRIPTPFPVKHGEASFPVNISGEPVPEGVASGVPALDAVTFYAGSERLTDVYPVDDPVALLDGADLRTSPGGNLSVRKATDQQATFNLHRGRELCVDNVGHFYLLADAILPFSHLLGEAIARRNEMQPKQELGIPEMVKRALMRDGWICRQTIIWHKPNPMPESVKDRCTKAHEYVFLLSKSQRYYFDAEAIAEAVQHPDQTRRVDSGGGDGKLDRGMYSGRAGSREDGLRNRRSVWSITTQPFSEAHFATMAPELAETCIKAGCPKDGTVLDPFGGAGTTGLCADRLNRNAVLIELNPEYVQIAKRRLEGDAGMFAEVAA